MCQASAILPAAARTALSSDDGELSTYLSLLEPLSPNRGLPPPFLVNRPVCVSRIAFCVAFAVALAMDGVAIVLVAVRSMALFTVLPADDLALSLLRCGMAAGCGIFSLSAARLLDICLPGDKSPLPLSASRMARHLVRVSRSTGAMSYLYRRLIRSRTLDYHF